MGNLVERCLGQTTSQQNSFQPLDSGTVLSRRALCLFNMLNAGYRGGRMPEGLVNVCLDALTIGGTHFYLKTAHAERERDQERGEIDFSLLFKYHRTHNNMQVGDRQKWPERHSKCEYENWAAVSDSDQSTSYCETSFEVKSKCTHQDFPSCLF